MKKLAQSKSLAVTVALVALLSFAAVIVVTGVDDRTAPTLATIIGHVGTLTAILVAAYKMADAAQKASVAAEKAEQTAIQTNGNLDRIVATAEKQTAVATTLASRIPIVRHPCHDPICEQDGKL